MAVPGSVFSPLSVGCHQLLRDGAGLVQNARDVLAELGGLAEVLDDPLVPPPGLGVEIQPPPGRDGMLRHLSDVLPSDPGELARKLHLPAGEVLARRVGLSFAETMTRLGRLELEGRVSRQGAGYVKVHRRGTSGSMNE